MILNIEVFKTGTHTDANGNTKEWTLEELQLIASKYNETLKEDPGREAPIVKGHPETDDPAYGWVKSLFVEDDILKAEIELIPEFAEEVKKELYKKVSIALYNDLMLRHIGFLGAVHPAVKNLEPVKFAAKADTTIDIAFEDGDSLAQYKAEQSARAEQYGINVKDGIGYIQKPKVYSDLTDDNFADPVNYLYPIQDKANWISSWRLFDNWENRENYKAIEKQIITARFINAAETLGIQNETKYWFTEFSIELKDNLKREKPELYKEHSEKDFGDPVHFRFPFKTLSELRASLAIFSRDNVQSQYSDSEKQYIASRLLTAAMNTGINLDPDKWNFTDVRIPVENLTKKQLEDFIKQSMTNSKSNISPQSKEFTMNEWLDKFVSHIIGWVTEASSEELAVQFQAEIDNYKANNPVPAGNAPVEEPQDPKMQAYAERVNALEKENRLMKFNQKADTLIQSGKLVPAQKDLVIQLNELLFNANQKLEFSEGNKKQTVNGLEAFDKLIESFPKQIEFSEQSNQGKAPVKINFLTPEKATIDESQLELHDKVLNYMEEQTKAGNNITYVKALDIISKL